MEAHRPEPEESWQNRQFDEQQRQVLDLFDVMRCYYDDDLCSGNIVEVNTHHKYLCEKCEKEVNSVSEDRLDADFKIGER